MSSVVGEIEKQVGRCFGIPTLDTSLHQKRNDQGEVVEQLQLSHFWVANVSSFTQNEDGIVVAVAKGVLAKQAEHGKDWWFLSKEEPFEQVDWHKGIILLPNYQDKGWTAPAEAVDLLDWNDPVADALQCVNLIPPGSTHNMLGNISSYHVSVGTQVGYSAFFFSLQGPEYPPQLRRLMSAIGEAIRHLAVLHNNPEINQFIAG